MTNLKMKIKASFSFRELKLLSFYRDLVSEAMVSCYLVMYVTFSMVTLNSEIYLLSMTHAGIMVGFLIYLLIEGYGPISGAHMNPSVSFAHWLSGRITLVRAVFYTVFQCAGAVMGSKIIHVLTPDHLKPNLMAFVPHPSITPWQGFLIEFLLTFNLLYVGLATTNHKTHVVMLPSLPTAFSIGVGIMAAGTWTGACQNPVVALGPAVISGNFSHHWIYWAGAYLAGAVAAATNQLFYMARTKPDTDKK